MQPLSIRIVGLALSAVAVVSYALCVLGGLIFPGLTSPFHVWLGLLPGFSWSFGGFLLGLVEAVLYSFWAALIFVPVYNYLQRNGVAQPTRTRPPLPAQ